MKATIIGGKLTGTLVAELIAPSTNLVPLSSPAQINPSDCGFRKSVISMTPSPRFEPAARFRSLTEVKKPEGLFGGYKSACKLISAAANQGIKCTRSKLARANACRHTIV